MRPLILAALLVFTFSAAHATPDAVTNQAISSLREKIAADKTPAGRVALLESFKDFLFARLQSIPIDETDAGKDAFARLNEFESYVFMMKMEKLSQGECAAAYSRISTSSATNLNYENESQINQSKPGIEALQLLKAVCQP